MSIKLKLFLFQEGAVAEWKPWQLRWHNAGTLLLSDKMQVE